VSIGKRRAAETIEKQARFAMVEWMDRGSEMSQAEFRRCVATVLCCSDHEASVIVNHSSRELVDSLPGELIPHGCGYLRMIRIIEETRAMVAANPEPLNGKKGPE
jgi:hypothetical protein